MFVFNRPFGAVAAGIGFALLVVVVSALCQGSPACGAAEVAVAPVTVAVQALPMAAQTPITCVRPEACGIVRAGS